MQQPTKYALITGGSSGIGLELSKIFAQNQYNLLLVAKFDSELNTAKAYFNQHFPQTIVHILQKDLSQATAAQQVFQWAKDQRITPQVLVNNAGFATYGYLQDIDLDTEIQMINLNILNVYRLTRRFLEQMLLKNEGHIINISSVAAFQPNATFATYGATKSFVYSFSRALNLELKTQNKNIRITTVCPPATRQTAFQVTAGMQNSRTFEGFGTTDAATVAQAAYQGFLQKKELVIPGGLRWLWAIINRLPTSLRMYLAQKQLK